MQAVIIAAGKSTRAYPLTLTRPKPLLKAANRTLLEHNLENLQGAVSEAIIVVGYKKNMIKRHIGSRYKSIRIRYAEQKQQLGTAHALSMAEKFIKGRFLLLMGDDIYSKQDIKNCAKRQYAILTAKTKNPQNFGVIVQKNGMIKDFVEKPRHFVSNLISTALYSLDRQIFSYTGMIKKSGRNELEMPDAIKLMLKYERIHCVRSAKWLPIAYPWDLLKADIFLRKNKNKIGKNSRISGTVRNSSIGNNCVIGGTVKNSIIMDSATIEKGSVVENSIIGENVRFSGTVKGKSAKSAVNGKMIGAGVIGAIIADNVTAKNAEIKAGCKIWPNKTIRGLVSEDIM